MAAGGGGVWPFADSASAVGGRAHLHDAEEDIVVGEAPARGAVGGTLAPLAQAHFPVVGKAERGGWRQLCERITREALAVAFVLAVAAHGVAVGLVQRTRGCRIEVQQLVHQRRRTSSCITGEEEVGAQAKLDVSALAVDDHR
jgi:hypothetical protein